MATSNSTLSNSVNNVTTKSCAVSNFDTIYIYIF